MPYVEEREFNLLLRVRCEFPEDYEGEADGYEWYREFPPIAAEIVRAAAALVAARPGWKVHTGNRGRSSEEEVMLVLERTPE